MQEKNSKRMLDKERYVPYNKAVSLQQQSVQYRRLDMPPNKKLRHCRLNRGLTQREVAKAFNIVPDYYSMLERGVRTPGFKLAKKIADFYGYIVDDLFFAEAKNDMFSSEQKKI
ncbi:MAG: XRE family transcriptional regulator [Dethiobacter sp.]|jgi:putative transcriptional regulator|nr:MAG: XRE family transcriptional regulator [Dethiobacter sp.]